MDENILVKTDNLNKATENILKKKNEIIDIYEKEIRNIIIQSRNSLTQNNIIYEEFLEDFDNLLKTFDKETSNIIDVLKRDIIPKYDNLSSELKNLFSDNFKIEINDLLKIDKGE